jgi:CelD/BcsL family acetyltransferase involved in cellulose biosynthesis
MNTESFLEFSPRLCPSATRTARLHRSQPIKITVVDPTLGRNWDRLAVSHPDFSFFHSAAWARVLSKTYGHEPVYLRFSQGAEVAALVPLMEVRSLFTGLRGVCAPFCDYCHPLVFGDCALGTVIENLTELARERNWEYLELRGGSVSEVSAARAAIFYGHTLDLRGGPENLFARLKSSARGAIRKAERSGLRVQVSQSREAILGYYRLHLQTRKRHGLPPQPLSFFLNIYNEIIKPGLGFVVTAHSGSRTAAAAVFFHMGKKAVYKFSASDEDLKQFQGNNLIVWEAIKLLAQNGVEELHFGRTPLENEGLRRFKLAWGTAEKTIEYFRYNTRADEWIIGRDGVPGACKAVFSKLPLTVNRLMGAVIYPHLD